VATLSINSNLAALNAQRRVASTSRELNDSYNRLSSGLRINRASDDASGLAISSDLQLGARVLQQGTRNLNDGLSALNIADGALEQLSNVVTRLQELAEQAANGVLGVKQRTALDSEAQSLKQEFLRITKSTEFNGRRLFDGDFGTLSLQSGFGSNGGLAQTLGGAVGTGSFQAQTSYASTGIRELVAADFNSDGILDLVGAAQNGTEFLFLQGNGDGTFKAARTTTAPSQVLNIAASDFNGDGTLDTFYVDGTANNLVIFQGNGNGTFRAPATIGLTGGGTFHAVSADWDGDGDKDILVTSETDNFLRVYENSGAGTFSFRISSNVGISAYLVHAQDFNGDGKDDVVLANTGSLSVKLSQGNGNFSSSFSDAPGFPTSLASGDFNNDGIKDLVAGKILSGQVLVYLGTGNGSFTGTGVIDGPSFPGETRVADFNGDGFNDLATNYYTGTIFSVALGNGNGTFKAAVSYTNSPSDEGFVIGDFNRDGVPDAVTSGFAGIQVNLGETTTGVAPIMDFSLKSIADSRAALSLLKDKQTLLLKQRAQVGAFQSRISVALNANSISAENFTSAYSQIRDVDVAEESATLLRRSIVLNAATAVLAQANAQPKIALDLLGETKTAGLKR